MKVVRHQHELVDDPAEAPDEFMEEIDEELAITIIEDDVGAVHAAIPDLIDAIGNFEPQRPRHEARLPQRGHRRESRRETRNDFESLLGM